MKRVAYIAGWAYAPLEMLGGRELTLMGQLTVYPKVYGDDDARPIKCYSTEVPGYLGMPIDWALEKFPNIGFEDRTTAGGECYYNRLPDPNHPRAAPGQAEFMADLDAAVADYHTVLAKAATGSGKTVTFLRTAALRGRRTLVLVHLERLARQWAKEINDKLGVPFDDIGWVQGDVCTWEKPFVVGLTNSVADRPYPKAFYTAFGTVGFDEGHRLGAPLFSQVIGKFPAQSKIMLTATDKRKDGCDKVFHYYFGQPKVRASQPAMRATVHSLTLKSYIPQWMTMPSQIATALAKSEDRNRLITRVAGKLYAKGRAALFIGDSVQHLQALMQMCRDRGIPEKDLGLYVDQKYTGQFRKRYSKVKAAARGDSYVYWKPMDESDAPYEQGLPVIVTEVIGGGHCKVRRIGHRIPLWPEHEVHISELRKRPEEVPVMEKVDREELNRIEIEARLIFATYGMLKEGIDIPRLDAGMDVTPRADGEQVIGRIRRPLPGKPEPLWYTIKDLGHPITEKSWFARVRDYRGCNCVVLEHDRF